MLNWNANRLSTVDFGAALRPWRRLAWIIGLAIYCVAILLVADAGAGCDPIPPRIASLGAFKLTDASDVRLLLEVNDQPGETRATVRLFVDGQVATMHYYGGADGVCLTEHCELDQVLESFVKEATLADVDTLQRQLLWQFGPPSDERLKAWFLQVKNLDGVPVPTRLADVEEWVYIDGQGSSLSSWLWVPMNVQVAQDAK